MPELNIPDIDLKSELKRCKGMEDLVGKNGLMRRLFGNIIQQFLEAEMEEHLGREKYEEFQRAIKIIVMGTVQRKSRLALESL